MPAVGSSSRRKWDSTASAVAISSERWSPWESSRAVIDLKPEPDAVEQGRRAAPDVLGVGAPELRVASFTADSASVRFARDDSSQNRFVCWNERPRPLLTSRHGAAPVMSSPSITT